MPKSGRIVVATVAVLGTAVVVYSAAALVRGTVPVEWVLFSVLTVICGSLMRRGPLQPPAHAAAPQPAAATEVAAVQAQAAQGPGGTGPGGGQSARHTVLWRVLRAERERRAGLVAGSARRGSTMVNRVIPGRLAAVTVPR